MQFDDAIPRFKIRLSEFEEAILANSPIDTEDARERVRAAGVNVFVSLEDFVDRIVSYNVWLLSSDHFLSTNFIYSPVEARRAVSQTLGNSLQSGDAPITWNNGGENTLGTLVRYLRAAADWIQGLPGLSRDKLIRPDRDLPHFANDELVQFPFRHVALWADSDPGELKRNADTFGRVVKLIEASEPAGVRNGLDHYRESERFPSSDKLLACVTRLRQALELADVHRFLPKALWLFGTKENRFGAAEYEFRDYAKRAVLVYGPSLVSGLEPLSYDGAFLLAPGNLLGTPNSPLVFGLRERSEFQPTGRIIRGGGGLSLGMENKSHLITHNGARWSHLAVN